ncbi:MFS transporter [Amycolatopsis regifaucium]|uniref:MFS transporter n=1 Tax=Amycolatopsis regifaucium TaxID=546365 RepID=A0A154MLG9_9PSEU|nr:MFS transporter [Amycolatopsis regifaucium]KZB85152.1 MFS transporter [Amycolatopsis regifaucium]OKA04177.1 MFS transporter [Amycolatopsis regifaucium]SFH92141.1 Major Facilitator Superfamily protein [Amycolatopsis regifaucium]
MSLLRNSGYWRWSLGVQLNRLPATMAPLAFTVLTTAATGSYRLGGVMMAVFVAAEMVGAVPTGRLLDRVGPARGLAAMLSLVAAGLFLLAAVASAGAPDLVLLALAIPPGLVAGGLNGGFRSLLAVTVTDEELPRAVSVDAMILEGVIVGGPLLVALLATSGPAVPVLAMAVVALLAALLVPRRTVAHAPQRTVERQRIPVAACVPWLFGLFSVGLLLSTVEVGLLPLVQRLGAPDSTTALVIVVLCAASIAGSALYAARGKVGDPRLFLAGFVVGGIAVSAGLGWAGLLGGVALIGLCTGPMMAVSSVNLQRLLPEQRRSEGFSLAFTVQASGFGLGSLAIGVLPVRLAPLFGVLAALVTCAMLVARPGQAIGTPSVTS